jgi:hypothetical protein
VLTRATVARPFAAVLGRDGNVWANWWNGSGWLWPNLDRPPAAPII